MSKIEIPKLRMNSGYDMPALGYGTWLGFDKKVQFKYCDIPKLIEALSYGIDIGYRHIDTSHFYRVEPEIGELVNNKIKDGVVTREEMFITNKVWHHYHREADVEVSVRNSLRRMNLEYFDLVLVHWPMSISVDGVDEKIDYLETYRGLEKVLQLGLTKSIGVSNFNIQQLTRLLANCNVPPACNQTEINLNYGHNEMVNLCKTHNIIVVAYAPFGTMLPVRAIPNSPEPKLNNPTMLAMGLKYGKSVTQLALRYLTQRGIVPIPKTITKSRVLENASIFDFTIDADDMATLAAFDVGFKTVVAPYWQEYSNYPFHKVDVKMDMPVGVRVWKNGVNQDID